MEKINLTYEEKEHTELRKRIEYLTDQNRGIIELRKRIEYLTDQNRGIIDKMKKIFHVWDGAFKVLGTIISVAIAVITTLVTKGLYDVDGKWSFWTIMSGGLIFLVVLALLLWATWALVNTLLMDRIDNILLGEN